MHLSLSTESTQSYNRKSTISYLCLKYSNSNLVSFDLCEISVQIYFNLKGLNRKGQMAVWWSDISVESDIFLPLCHSSCSTLSFKSPLSKSNLIQLLPYYLFLWDLIKVWTVRCRRIPHDFSPYLLVSSASDLQLFETAEPTTVQI